MQISQHIGNVVQNDVRCAATGFAGLSMEEAAVITKEARRRKQRQYAALGRNAPPFNTYSRVLYFILFIIIIILTVFLG